MYKLDDSFGAAMTLICQAYSRAKSFTDAPTLLVGRGSRCYETYSCMGGGGCVLFAFSDPYQSADIGAVIDGPRSMAVGRTLKKKKKSFTRRCGQARYPLG